MDIAVLEEEPFNKTGNHSNVDQGRVPLQVAFGFIAVTAFLSNGLLCYVILTNRQMLTSSYNVFIFSLAVTDLLTGKKICPAW
jgi:hypothetical protein